jgi:hypothetical protein
VICPACSGHVDEALTPSGRIPPQDWDPVVCFHCGALAVIDHVVPGHLRNPSTNDIDAWQSDSRLARLLDLQQAAMRRTNTETQDGDQTT